LQTEGSGSDASVGVYNGSRLFKCASADTHIYARLEALSAMTPVSGGVITLEATGIQLLG